VPAMDHFADRIDILGFTSEELAAEASRSAGVTAGLAPRIYARCFRTGLLDPRSEGASERNAEAWRRRFSVGLLEVSDREEAEGEAGRTVKFAFRLADALSIESVAIPMYGGSYTLCVSSQAGCARSCAFCETGRSGLLRDLSAAEIVAQVLSSSLALGLRFRNIVFMGMGEPLDNLPNVAQAIAVLRDRRGFAYAQERLTVCTSGNAEGIEALGRLGLPRLNLSVSLNAARDGLRDRLMPINRRYPLSRLAEALASYPKRRNFVLAANYCLIPGLNDSEADLDAVAAFIAPLGRVLVNLIPYNPGREPIGRSPTETETETFIAGLEARGVAVRRRVEKGRSLMAACGQLGGREA